jgi:hypothetical protein
VSLGEWFQTFRRIFVPACSGVSKSLEHSVPVTEFFTGPLTLKMRSLSSLERLGTQHPVSERSISGVLYYIASKASKFASPMQTKAPQSFRRSKTTYPTTQCYIPDDLNSQQLSIPQKSHLYVDFVKYEGLIFWFH